MCLCVCRLLRVLFVRFCGRRNTRVASADQLLSLCAEHLPVQVGKNAQHNDLKYIACFGNPRFLRRRQRRRMYAMGGTDVREDGSDDDDDDDDDGDDDDDECTNAIGVYNACLDSIHRNGSERWTRDDVNRVIRVHVGFDIFEKLRQRRSKLPDYTWHGLETYVLCILMLIRFIRDRRYASIVCHVVRVSDQRTPTFAHCPDWRYDCRVCDRALTYMLTRGARTMIVRKRSPSLT